MREMKEMKEMKRSMRVLSSKTLLFSLVFVLLALTAFGSVSTFAESKPDPVPEYSKEDQKLLEETGTITHHEPVESDELTWEFDEASGTLTIKGSGPMKDYYDASAKDHNDRMYWDRDATTGYIEDAILPPWSEHAYDIFNIVVEDGVTTIGDYAFFGYINCESFSVPDTVEYIGRYAFSWTGIKNMDLPANLKEIAECGFSETRVNVPLVIPDGTEIIGKWAFYANCFDESITIPKSVFFIHETAFANSLDLHHFIVEQENEYYVSVDGILYNKEMTVMMNCPIYNETEDLVIPDTVVRIGDWALGQNYFIKTVTIPASVKEVGESCFNHLYVLEKYIVDDKNTIFQAVDDILYSADGKTLYSYPDLKEGESFGVPSGIETIEDCAFSGCHYLKNLYIPDSVKYIDNYALRPLYNISLYLPEGITEKTEMHQSNLLSNESRIGSDYSKGFTYLPPGERDQRKAIIYLYESAGQEVPSEEELDQFIEMGMYDDMDPVTIMANGFIQKETLQVYYGGSQEKWDAYVEKMKLNLKETKVTCNAEMPKELVKLSETEIPSK